MEKHEQIREALRKLAGQVGPDFSLLGTVKSVDEGANTCVLHDDESGLDFPDVRLRPVLDGNTAVTLIPKVNTWTLAVRIESSEDWMTIAFGEIAKAKIECEEWVFNGGDNGGLVKWPEAKTELDKVKSFITTFVNALATPVNEPGNGAPSAFQAALNIAYAAYQHPSFENLEDSKIKH